MLRDLDRAAAFFRDEEGMVEGGRTESIVPQGELYSTLLHDFL